MALMTSVSELWTVFNRAEKGFLKGQALLNYMWDNWEPPAEGKKLKKILWRLPGYGTGSICQRCWGLAAGFVDMRTGKMTATFGAILAKFNKGIRSATSEKVVGSMAVNMPKNKEDKVLRFLREWVLHAQDHIPEDVADTVVEDAPGRVHVDVASKREIWHLCCDELRDEMLAEGAQVSAQELKIPVSENWFLRILDQHYDIVIHKHKRFAQCIVCFMLKQLASRAACAADRLHVKKHRGLHYKTVRLERIEYHLHRRAAQEAPWQVISIIIDGMSKWKTALPLFGRELKFSNFKAYGQQLYGVLVHQDVRKPDYRGGFFGYLVDSAVHGGANLTVELLYRTLQALELERKTWAPELKLQLDNTCSDNKNDTVLAFCAFLVGTGVFRKVTLSFLPVGHTHEDIDAVFGIIVRYLSKIGAVQTITKLLDYIWQCLTSDADGKMSTSWKPSSELQRVRATHDWDKWLKKAGEEAQECNVAAGRKRKTKPFRKVKHYAMTTGSKACADNRRPHRFEFSLEGEGSAAHVVMQYYHWSHDTKPWAGAIPIPMMNYMPDLQWLRPAKLDESVVNTLQQCLAGTSPCGKCVRCTIQSVFQDNNQGYRAADVFSDADRAEWDNVFQDLTTVKAHATLPELRPLPKAPEASVQSRTFTVPLSCQHPEGVLPPPLEHSPHDIELHSMMQAFKQQNVRAAVSRGQGSSGTGCTGTVDNVVGARRDPDTGDIEVAIVWLHDNPSTGGTWEPIEILELKSPEEIGMMGDDQDGPSNADYTGLANWKEHFGPDIAPGTDVIVVWNQSGAGKQSTRQAFQGVIGDNYDEPMHLIHTPKQKDDPELGTRKSTNEEYYMDLSNLATDYSNSQVDTNGEMATTYLEAWVLRDHWQQEFIQKHLFPAVRTPQPVVSH
jgi:hypothetical protein